MRNSARWNKDGGEGNEAHWVGKPGWFSFVLCCAWQSRARRTRPDHPSKRQNTINFMLATTSDHQVLSGRYPPCVCSALYDPATRKTVTVGLDVTTTIPFYGSFHSWRRKQQQLGVPLLCADMLIPNNGDTLFNLHLNGQHKSGAFWGVVCHAEQVCPPKVNWFKSLLEDHRCVVRSKPQMWLHFKLKTAADRHIYHIYHVGYIQRCRLHTMCIHHESSLHLFSGTNCSADKPNQWSLASSSSNSADE